MQESVLQLPAPHPVPYCICLRTHQEMESLPMPGQPNPEFLRRAITLATRNVLPASGGPFGAVVVRDGKIVGEGANSVTITNDPTAHGEANPIRAAAKSLGTFSLAGCALT